MTGYPTVSDILFSEEHSYAIRPPRGRIDGSEAFGWNCLCAFRHVSYM